MPICSRPTIFGMVPYLVSPVVLLGCTGHWAQTHRTKSSKGVLSIIEAGVTKRVKRFAGRPCGVWRHTPRNYRHCVDRCRSLLLEAVHVRDVSPPAPRGAAGKRKDGRPSPGLFVTATTRRPAALQSAQPAAPSPPSPAAPGAKHKTTPPETRLAPCRSG